jgi:AcrR family transcriptional regulator
VNPTRQKLLDAAADVLRHEGVAGIGARPIAARAGVNQALVFYHFDGIGGLVDAAVRRAVDDSAAGYADDLAGVHSLGELLAVGRRLHDRERAAGNVLMMAHLMAGAQQDEALAGAARYALTAWTARIAPVVSRVVDGSPLAELVDVDGLTGAIVAGFLGLELVDGVDPAGATRSLDTLESLGVLVEVVDELGPIARRALRTKVRRLRRASRKS